jgi:hypothetical protein
MKLSKPNQIQTHHIKTLKNIQDFNCPSNCVLHCHHFSVQYNLVCINKWYWAIRLIVSPKAMNLKGSFIQYSLVHCCFTKLAVI